MRFSVIPVGPITFASHPIFYYYYYYYYYHYHYHYYGQMERQTNK